MKIFRGLFVAALIVILSAGLYGCGASDYQKSIFDDDSKISREGDSFFYKNRIGNTMKDSIGIEFSEFTGLETIWIIDSKEDGDISVSFDSKVSEGKFKGVLVTPDSTVSKFMEQEQSGDANLKVKKGKNRIKLVGNNATGEVNIKIKIGSDMTVKKPEN